MAKKSRVLNNFYLPKCSVCYFNVICRYSGMKRIVNRTNCVASKEEPEREEFSL